MICKVGGCGKTVRTRGWCSAHYWRWHRHGDPLGGKASRGEVRRFYQETVLTYEGDECLFWPYASAGRGYACMEAGDGRTRYVHRRLCEDVNGPPTFPEAEAAHSCGKGHLGCVTKRHLSWKTRAGNHADKLIHGTSNRGERHGQSRITEPEARSILALKDKKTQREIAAEFAVSQGIVARIHSRQTWAWL